MKRISLLLVAIICLVNVNIHAQNRTITGVVSDDQGQALPGVAIFNKTINKGTVSDIDGVYSIAVHSNNDVLTYSFIGMQAHEEIAGNRNVINVTLENDICELEEVVAIGYGVMKKECLTGAVYGCNVRKGKRNKPIMIRGCSTYNALPDMTYTNEAYASVSENGYKKVTDEPLSTFSVDVDKAAYSNIRRFLNAGQLPPADAVRIEEMINYFSYDYDQPQDEHPFAVKSDMSECPWNKEHYLLHVGLKGQEIEKDNLPASNLVFLIDVSGSMSGANKLPLLKSSFRLLVNELREEDYVSIVVYAGAAGLVLEPTSGANKSKILAALDNLEAGGSTAGGAGLKLAYKTAKEHFHKNGNNRIILATDGDFNVGQSSNDAMEKLVANERDNGIYMTVLGFGMVNYKDDRMEIIADKGNGNYAYIDNLQEAQKTLVSEFGGTLFTIAKDVKFQIEFNPNKVLAYRLIGYENRMLNDEDFNDDTKDAGEIGAGHTVTALYEIIPQGAKDGKKWIKSVDPLKYQKTSTSKKAVNNAYDDEWLTLKLRYKQPKSTQSQLMKYAIKGDVKSFDEANEDLRFAASVAGFGMLLRNSDYKGNLSYDKVRSIAKKSRGNDEDGYKAEMIRLIKTAELLSTQLAIVE